MSMSAPDNDKTQARRPIAMPASREPWLMAAGEVGDESDRWAVTLVAGGVALAAVAAIGLTLWLRTWDAPETRAAAAQAEARGGHSLALADGSVAEMSAGSEVRPDFSAAERRVRLVRGGAHFAVTKNPERPFVVMVGPVMLRADGAAFDVRLVRSAVNVLVTKGQVRVERGSPVAAAGAWLEAGQGLQIALAAADVAAVAQLASAQLDAGLGR